MSRPAPSLIVAPPGAEAITVPAGFVVRRFAGTLSHARTLSRPIRVAHLTDLHVGRVTPARVFAETVNLTNALEPDLVVITGDFVCHSQAYLDLLTATIQGFDAPVLTVLGNHDYWCGAPEVAQALRRGGAEVLDNAHTTLTIHGEKLQIVGVDDEYTGHARVERAVKGLTKDVATLGLSHIGEVADALWPHGVPLVLSGHTHAGQVTVAKLHELAIGRVVGHRYVHGLYGERRVEAGQDGAVYVGAGIGAAVLPLRVGPRARREIAIFELGAAPGHFAEPMAEQLPHRGRPPTARKQDARIKEVARRRARRLRRLKAAGPDAPPKA